MDIYQQIWNGEEIDRKILDILLDNNQDESVSRVGFWLDRDIVP